jgi:hypothetical protein
MSEQVTIKADLERMKDFITVDEMVGMQSGTFRDIRNVLSRFVVGEGGEFLPEEEGRKAVGSLTIRQLEEAAIKFRGGMSDAAVPPVIVGG